MASRNTVQRTIIESALRELCNHPTADEVFEAVSKEHPSISRATVYRTLARLSDEGVINRVRINNGADRFDHTTFAHYHVRCTCCGRVDDVMISAPAGLDEMAARTTGYRIDGHSLQFDGVCPACLAKEAEEAQKAGGAQDAQEATSASA